MKRLLLTIFFALFLPLVTLYASQETGDKIIETEGYGSSKQDALLQAKRAAVEEGIGVVLSSETEVYNFILKKDRVITRSYGAVRSYTLLSEKQEDSTWFVRISAVVSLDSITADLMALKILLLSMDKPRTMVLIQEEDGQNAESTVIDYLQTKGFELVDPAQTATLMARDNTFIRKAIDGDPLAAARLGAENGAEYVLIGDVKKSLLTNEVVSSLGMKSGQANLTVKVVNCSTGRIVATKSATGAAIHISEDTARSQAAAKAAATLMDKKLFEVIVKSFQDTVNNGANYDINIFGVKSYGVQKNVTMTLRSIEGVVTITKRNFGDGKLILSMVFKGSADTFCDRVDGKQIDNAKLQVTSVIGNRLFLNLQE